MTHILCKNCGQSIELSGHFFAFVRCPWCTDSTMVDSTTGPLNVDQKPVQAIKQIEHTFEYMWAGYGVLCAKTGHWWTGHCGYTFTRLRWSGGRWVGRTGSRWYDVDPPSELIRLYLSYQSIDSFLTISAPKTGTQSERSTPTQESVGLPAEVYRPTPLQGWWTKTYWRTLETLIKWSSVRRHHVASPCGSRLTIAH